MGQEFFIKSGSLESKVRQLLPSQGGLGAGFDLSASTQIVPIVDLTESAEGSNFRQDLQRSLSLNSVTAFNITNSTATIINNTGYFRIFGNAVLKAAGNIQFRITDGVTTKLLISYNGAASLLDNKPFDFLVFLEAGHSVTCTSTVGNTEAIGVTRQIADIDGNLTNP